MTSKYHSAVLEPKGNADCAKMDGLLPLVPEVRIFLWSLLNIINKSNPISYSFSIHRKISAESNENKLTAVHPLSEPFFYHIPTPANFSRSPKPIYISTCTVFHTGGRDARSVFKSPKRKLQQSESTKARAPTRKRT